MVAPDLVVGYTVAGGNGQRNEQKFPQEHHKE